MPEKPGYLWLWGINSARLCPLSIGYFGGGQVHCRSQPSRAATDHETIYYWDPFSVRYWSCRKGTPTTVISSSQVQNGDDLYQPSQ